MRTRAPQTAGLPRVMFGTASLGNLYRDVPYEDKKARHASRIPCKCKREA